MVTAEGYLPSVSNEAFSGLAIICDEIDNALTLSFRMVIPKKAYVTVMIPKEGNWEHAEIEFNDDGTVSVTF